MSTRSSQELEEEQQYRRDKSNIMSTSLAYSVGVGGLPRRIDPHINLGPIKRAAAPLFKRETYTRPLKRLSLSSPISGSNSTAPQQDLIDEAKPANGSPKVSKQTLEPEAKSTAVVETVESESETNNNYHGKALSSPNQPEYHSLDSTSPESQVSAILSLSDTIFSEIAPASDNKYSSFSLWKERLSLPNSIIFFATVPSTTLNADVDSVGFVFAYPRSVSDYSTLIKDRLNLSESDGPDGKLLHIWLCGVSPDYRSKGVFNKLMSLTEKFAREHGFKLLTVATVPKTFERMFTVLKGSGWIEVERTEVGEGEAAYEKVYLSKSPLQGHSNEDLITDDIGLAK
jgi:GNAT superfamily N-acetyltransferase